MACREKVLTQSRTRHQGFTLVEAMVTLAVLGILAALTAPSFKETILNLRLEGKAREYVNHMNWARSMAVSNNETVSLRMSSDGSASCYMLFRGPLNECSCNSTGASCSTPANALLTIVFPYEEGVRIRPGANSFTAQISPSQGTITPTMTVVFTADSGKAIHNISNTLARTRSCTPEQGNFGLPICQ